jgi:hypothetical protein
MSQVHHPYLTARNSFRAHRIAVLSALLALIATTAVVLVLAIDRGSSGSVAVSSQPALRTDGGPSESAVAASVGSQPSTGPDESTVAASVGGATPPTSSGPDESTVAASVGRATPPTPVRLPRGGPDPGRVSDGRP